MRVNSFQRWDVESMFRRDMFHLDTGGRYDSMASGMPCLVEKCCSWRYLILCWRVLKHDLNFRTSTLGAEDLDSAESWSFSRC